MRKLRIVLWFGEGGNQKALAHKIAAEFELCGIVLNKKKPKKYTYKKIANAVWYRLRFRQIISAWKRLMAWYEERYPGWPEVPVLTTYRINTEETVRFTEGLRPDLIVVSGTALIKDPLLQMKPTIGIINLHTGLSPYIKGGPNCTNWCIAKGQWHLVGNTIMWIDKGIDSGNIISTETIDIRKAKDLFEAHTWVMEHAHDLYIRSMRYLASAVPPYISVKQCDIDPGKTYYTREWVSAPQNELLKNWKKRGSAPLGPKPVTVALPE